MTETTSSRAGPIIGVVVLAAFVGAIAFIVHTATANKPKVWSHDIGLIGDLATQAAASPDGQPWPGMVDDLIAIHDVLATQYPGVAEKLFPGHHLWVEAFAKTATITSFFVRDGHVVTEDGKRHTVNGTIDFHSPFGGLGSTDFIMKIRIYGQMACDSGLGHEVGEHLVPWLAQGDWNPGHALPWQKVSATIDSECRRLYSARRAVPMSIVPAVGPPAPAY